jgi:hypothetical protein
LIFNLLFYNTRTLESLDPEPYFALGVNSRLYIKF